MLTFYFLLIDGEVITIKASSLEQAKKEIEFELTEEEYYIEDEINCVEWIENGFKHFINYQTGENETSTNLELRLKQFEQLNLTDDYEHEIPIAYE